jgi:hypothetical protein
MNFGPEWFVVLGLVGIVLFAYAIGRAFRQGRKS